MKIIGWCLFHGEEFCIGAAEDFDVLIDHVKEYLPYLKPIDADKSIWRDRNNSIWTIRYLNGNERINTMLIGLS